MDVLDLDDPSVRRVEPPARVWVNLDAMLGGRRPGSWRGRGLVLQPSPGLLVGWVRSVGHGWAGIVEVMLYVAGHEVSSRMLVPAEVITRDSVEYRRKLGGKTSNRPTMAQRSS